MNEELIQIMKDIYQCCGECKLATGYSGIDGQGYIEFAVLVDMDGADLDHKIPEDKLEALGVYMEQQFAPEDYNQGHGGRGQIFLTVPGGSVMVEHYDHIYASHPKPHMHFRLEEEAIHALELSK